MLIPPCCLYSSPYMMYMHMLLLCVDIHQNFCCTGDMLPSSSPPIIKQSTEEKTNLEKRISPSDRIIIKQHIFDAIIHQRQHVIRIQLLEVCYGDGMGWKEM